MKTRLQGHMYESNSKGTNGEIFKENVNKKVWQLVKHSLPEHRIRKVPLTPLKQPNPQRCKKSQYHRSRESEENKLTS